jgi:ribosome maturation factor RimP
MEITQRDPVPTGSTPRVDVAAVRAAVEPVVSAHGLDLVEVEWTGGVLRVFIERRDALERPDSGVTLDDCVAVSRDLSTALDVADLIPHGYNLEVSSPGLDRPLTRPADFQRHVGRLAKIKLHAPASDGQLALRGPLLGASADTVSIEADGKRFDVPLANVREAKLVFELGAAPKQKRGKRKKK